MNATRMLHGRGRLLVPALLLSCLVFSACSPDAETEEEATAEAEEEGPEGEGTSTRVTLSEAAHRTADIQVEAVRSDTDDRSAGGLEVPGNV